MPSQSLEQQALDRVARMYSSFDRRPHGQPQPPRSEQKPPEPQPPMSEPEQPKPESSGGLLDVLFEDKEQSLIMLLLVILMKDGADMSTVLALMYLLI